MKKITVIFTALALILSLCACGQSGTAEGSNSAEPELTYQDYYDLGVRYLSEGNYEEAVLAFTAAIEIDPKQAPAFVGRGDAYTGMGQLSMAQVEEGTELTQEADLAYHSAVTDYLSAIELDASTPEVYRKAAEAYVLLGDTEAAIEILKQGIEATGDESLQAQLDALLQGATASVDVSELVTVKGYIIDNFDEYRDTMQAYMDQHLRLEEGVICSIDTYGMRFESPVTVHLGDSLVSIQEAYPMCVAPELADDLFNDTMVGLRMELTGYFGRLENAGEVVIPYYDENQQLVGYYYRANGDYFFSIESYVLLNE